MDDEGFEFVVSSSSCHSFSDDSVGSDDVISLEDDDGDGEGLNRIEKKEDRANVDGRASLPSPIGMVRYEQLGAPVLIHRNICAYGSSVHACGLCIPGDVVNSGGVVGAGKDAQAALCEAGQGVGRRIGLRKEKFRGVESSCGVENEDTIKSAESPSKFMAPSAKGEIPTVALRPQDETPTRLLPFLTDGVFGDAVLGRSEVRKTTQVSQDKVSCSSNLTNFIPAVTQQSQDDCAGDVSRVQTVSKEAVLSTNSSKAEKLDKSDELYAVTQTQEEIHVDADGAALTDSSGDIRAIVQTQEETRSDLATPSRMDTDVVSNAQLEISDDSVHAVTQTQEGFLSDYPVSSSKDSYRTSFARPEGPINDVQSITQTQEEIPDLLALTGNGRPSLQKESSLRPPSPAGSDCRDLRSDDSNDEDSEETTDSTDNSSEDQSEVFSRPYSMIFGNRSGNCKQKLTPKRRKNRRLLDVAQGAVPWQGRGSGAVPWHTSPAALSSTSATTVLSSDPRVPPQLRRELRGASHRAWHWAVQEEMAKEQAKNPKKSKITPFGKFCTWDDVPKRGNALAVAKLRKGTSQENVLVTVFPGGGMDTLRASVLRLPAELGGGTVPEENGSKDSRDSMRNAEEQNIKEMNKTSGENSDAHDCVGNNELKMKLANTEKDKTIFVGESTKNNSKGNKQTRGQEKSTKSSNKNYKVENIERDSEKLEEEVMPECNVEGDSSVKHKLSHDIADAAIYLTSVSPDSISCPTIFVPDVIQQIILLSYDHVLPTEILPAPTSCILVVRCHARTHLVRLSLSGGKRLLFIPLAVVVLSPIVSTKLTRRSLFPRPHLHVAALPPEYYDNLAVPVRTFCLLTAGDGKALSYDGTSRSGNEEEETYVFRVQIHGLPPWGAPGGEWESSIPVVSVHRHALTPGVRMLTSIEYARHPMVLHGVGCFQSQADQIGHGRSYSFLQIDLRTGSVEVLWCPSASEFKTFGSVTVRSMLPHPTDDRIAYVTVMPSKSCHRTYFSKCVRLDLRRPVRATCVWSLAGTGENFDTWNDDEPGADLLCAADVGTRDKPCDGGGHLQPEAFVAVPLEIGAPPTFQLYQCPEAMGGGAVAGPFHTQPLEIPGPSCWPNFAAQAPLSMARTYSFSMPDLNARLFCAGLVTVRVPWRGGGLHSHRKVKKNDPPTHALLVLTMTSLGDLHGHVLIENDFSETPSSVAFEGLPVGQTAVPFLRNNLNKSEKKYDVNYLQKRKLGRGIELMLSNRYPVSSCALDYFVEEKDELSKFDTLNLQEIKKNLLQSVENNYCKDGKSNENEDNKTQTKPWQSQNEWEQSAEAVRLGAKRKTKVNYTNLDETQNVLVHQFHDLEGDRMIKIGPPDSPNFMDRRPLEIPAKHLALIVDPRTSSFEKNNFSNDGNKIDSFPSGEELQKEDDYKMDYDDKDISVLEHLWDNDNFEEDEADPEIDWETDFD